MLRSGFVYVSSHRSITVGDVVALLPQVEPGFKMLIVFVVIAPVVIDVASESCSNSAWSATLSTVH